MTNHKAPSVETTTEWCARFDHSCLLSFDHFRSFFRLFRSVLNGCWAYPTPFCWSSTLYCQQLRAQPALCPKEKSTAVAQTCGGAQLWPCAGSAKDLPPVVGRLPHSQAAVFLKIKQAHNVSSRNAAEKCYVFSFEKDIITWYYNIYPVWNFPYKKGDLEVLTKRPFCNRTKFQPYHFLGNAHSPV